MYMDAMLRWCSESPIKLGHAGQSMQRANTSTMQTPPCRHGVHIYKSRTCRAVNSKDTYLHIANTSMQTWCSYIQIYYAGQSMQRTHTSTLQTHPCKHGVHIYKSRPCKAINANDTYLHIANTFMQTWCSYTYIYIYQSRPGGTINARHRKTQENKHLNARKNGH